MLGGLFDPDPLEEITVPTKDNISWRVIGVVPVYNKGFLACYATQEPGELRIHFRMEGPEGSKALSKWIRKCVRLYATLLCWDSPLTAAEFREREIDRQCRDWVNHVRPGFAAEKALVRASAQPYHLVATQRMIGLPVPEQMALRQPMLQPKLICENTRPELTKRGLYITEVNAALAIALHEESRERTWYRDDLGAAWDYYRDAGSLWRLCTHALPVPEANARKIRMKYHVDALVAMALGVRWIRRNGVELAGSRKEGTTLLPFHKPEDARITARPVAES